MAIKKSILPPPMNPQEKPITVAVLSGKLDALFVNVKELVTSTVRGTENRLNNKIEITQHAVSEHTKMIKNLDANMQQMEKRLGAVEKNVADVSTKMDKVVQSVNFHETRLSIAEEKLETHLTTHP